MGILEGIEDEDERCLTALGSTSEHVGDAGEPARLDDERYPLVTVKTGECGQRAALHLDDRDAQARGVQDKLLQWGPALWHDEQA